ncbi:glycoprotease pgp1 [Paracoccidioides lutzii Pb01]|uniref:Glycoprotease pgp1 n=1 Tax=Paracoccidioides lutzii (strain ATCC MYA-826 / Pb01) TaxID=502779 RepID=C1H4K3_PARBA|nr:glycoprotease pgp1 [Paracoccidioides lutzii Pb01]EEH34647.2 glycoprotease pgp1 [Paracoccidioides lutzii Pb01]
MFSTRQALRGLCCHSVLPHNLVSGQRHLLTLAIESSCDDTSVAIIEKHGVSSPSRSSILFLENITADSRKYQGIHPAVALDSHQANTAKLVNKALAHLPPAQFTSVNDVGRVICLPSSATDGTTPHLRRKPDFISVTRGPGMRSNLSVGLDTAKGLSVAWQVPIVGVHHMQAHLLTPRLAASLQQQQQSSENSSACRNNPSFPFMSILVSGGHTLLVHSKSIVDHEILASTSDSAIGDALDKTARMLLPQSFLEKSTTTMYGKMLEEFAFPNGPSDYADYRPPATRGEELVKLKSERWGWSFSMPFAENRRMEFSFSGVTTRARDIYLNRREQWEAAGNSGEGFMSNDERIEFARAFMTVCFGHLASRTIIALQELRQQQQQQQQERENQSPPAEDIQSLIISGGVGANQFLKKLFRSYLDIRGFPHVDVIAPPPYLCTDNAAMIGWAGIEMFEAGWRSDLQCRPLRKWTLDARAGDGGILGPDDWLNISSLAEKP